MPSWLLVVVRIPRERPGAPLQQGGWGVDVVETRDPDGFLQAINWSGLTAGRPADGIFQVIDRQG